MAIRLATLPVREVMAMTGVRGYPHWAGGVTVDDGLIERHLANDDLIEPDDNRDPNAPIPAAEHAGRIAWLIRNVRPNRCSVTIRDGLIQDGNHRFAAALYRGDDLVSCCFME
ncbi:MAG: hypothetical protein RLO51_10335 [Thalassobaculum sp.]|uniref:hypothetical protein n=1 Tax=Thalassobaculum sp. TaxID=2022740 RepID=UPI0032EAC3D3